MKKIIKTKGVILNSKPYKDNLKVLTVLCEDGIHSVLLKGSDKLNSGNKKYTIIPVEVEFMMTDSNNLPTFTEGYILNNYTNIKNDNNKSLISFAIIEKILAFSEHIDNHKLVYDFTINIFNLLDKFEQSRVILSLFEIKLLFLIGIAPILTKCIKCGKSNENLSLSIKLGGCCCPNCSVFEEYDLNNDETKIFKYLYLIKMDKIDNEFLTLIENTKIDFNKTIDKYYEKYMDFHNKTKKIIEKVS